MKQLLLFLIIFFTFSCSKIDKKSTHKNVSLDNTTPLKLEEVTCANLLDSLLTYDSLRTINLDSIKSLGEYFKLKKNYSEAGKVSLIIDQVKITIDCSVLKSHGGLFYAPGAVDVWKLSEHKSRSSTKISLSDDINFLSRSIKRQTFNFYEQYYVKPSDKEKYNDIGPKFLICLSRGSKIHSIKALIKASLEGYLEYIQKSINHPICDLTKKEIDYYKRQRPYQIRLSFEK